MLFCQALTFNPIFRQWRDIPLASATPVACGLKVKVSCSKGHGLFLNFAHAENDLKHQCDGQVRYTRSYVAQKLTANSSVVRHGGLGVQQSAEMRRQAGVPGASSSMTRNAVMEVKDTLFASYTRDSFFKFGNWAEEFLKANSGSKILVLLKLPTGQLLVVDCPEPSAFLALDDPGSPEVPFSRLNPPGTNAEFINALHREVATAYTPDQLHLRISRDAAALSELTMRFVTEKQAIEAGYAECVAAAVADLPELQERRANDLDKIQQSIGALRQPFLEGIRLAQFRLMHPVLFDAGNVDAFRQVAFSDSDGWRKVAQGEIMAVTLVYETGLATDNSIGTRTYHMDGCHVKDGQKSDKKGWFLTISTGDPTGSHSLLSSTYCFSESAANLTFAIDGLASAGLELNKRTNIIMIDRGAANLSMARVRLPDAAIRFCEWHLKMNANAYLVKHRWGKMSSQARDILGACFRDTTKASFERNWNKLGQENTPLQEYMAQIPQENWATHTFLDSAVRGCLLSSFGRTTNNAAESTNHSLAEARRVERSPLEYLIACANVSTTQGLARQKRAVRMNDADILIPLALQSWNDKKAAHQEWVIELRDLNNGVFYVRWSKSKSIHTGCMVRLNERTCESKEWQDRLAPCRHVAAIAANHADYLPPNFKHIWWGQLWQVANYRRSCARTTVVPVSEHIPLGEEAVQLAGGNVLPRGAGRPSKEARILSTGEA
jgi:hypothetical protein